MYEQLLTEGLLTYGYVTKAENVNLEIALPKGLTGIVNATNISPTYTSYLKSLVKNGRNSFSQQADHTLPNLFPKGSFIVCKVISTKNNTFNLSLSPEDINSLIEPVQIKNNMIIVGSVKSVEDHGYIMDIGLKDIHAFLSKENASKYNDGKQIKMGQQLHCLVVDVTRIKRNVIRSVTLSADPFKIATQMIKDPLSLPLSCICPGLQAEATIVKDEGSYLEAKFLMYNAVIPKCYCNPDGQTPKVNSLVRTTVLQYHPETNVIILTLRMTYSSEVSEIFPDIFIGKIIKGVVKYISPEKEIYLLLSNGLWAVARPPDNTAQKRSTLLKAFPVQSKQRCCVMRLLPLENLVEVCLSWKTNVSNTESSSVKDTLPADESKKKSRRIRKEEKIKAAEMAKQEVGETAKQEVEETAKQEVEEKKSRRMRKEEKIKAAEMAKQEVGETAKQEVKETAKQEVEEKKSRRMRKEEKIKAAEMAKQEVKETAKQEVEEKKSRKMRKEEKIKAAEMAKQEVGETAKQEVKETAKQEVEEKKSRRKRKGEKIEAAEMAKPEVEEKKSRRMRKEEKIKAAEMAKQEVGDMAKPEVEEKKSRRMRREENVKAAKVAKQEVGETAKQEVKETAKQEVEEKKSRRMRKEEKIKAAEMAKQEVGETAKQEVKETAKQEVKETAKQEVEEKKSRRMRREEKIKAAEMAKQEVGETAKQEMKETAKQEVKVTAKPEVEEKKSRRMRREEKIKAAETAKQEVKETAKQEVEEKKSRRMRKEEKIKAAKMAKQEVEGTSKPEVEEAEESRSEITKSVETSKVESKGKIGKVSRGTIVEKLENGFKVLLASGKLAVLPKMHLSDFPNHCDVLWDIYKKGDMVRVVNFKHLNKTTICSSKISLRLTAKKGDFVQSFKNIQVGQNLIGIVKTVVGYGVFVEFPGDLFSLAVTKDITSKLDINLPKYFKEGMTVYAHVCGIDQKKLRFKVSLKLRKDDGDSDFQRTYFRKYFKETKTIIDRLKSTKNFPWSLQDLHTGQMCSVTVNKVVKGGVHCTLESGTKGFIAMHHSKGLAVKKDMKVAAVILDVDLLQGIVQLVASPVVVKQVVKMQRKPTKIPKDRKIKSTVLLVRKEFIIVLLTMKGKARLAYLSPKMHMSDVFSWDSYKVGDKQLVQFVRRIDGKYIVKLYQPDKWDARLTKGSKETTSHLETARISDKDGRLLEAMDVDKDSKRLESSKLGKKKTARKRKSEGNIDSDDDDGGTRKSVAGKKSKLNSEKPIEVMAPVFFNWDNEIIAPTSQNGYVSSSDDDVEMSDDKNEDSSTSKLLKKKKAARKLEKKQEEERLYEIERQRVVGEKLPETADDFDRLLLHSPNSSMLWLRYMAFHLETAEIDKARSIAERALKTILFREEQEKFNVWIAYMNLENLYGTKENLNVVLQRALQQNQPLKVYQQLVNIYMKSGKTQAARDVYDILLKRFRKEKEVWIHFAVFCFKNDFLEQGRELIEKAVQVIDKKNHVTLISKVAQLEFKYGDVQRGTTMFENIVSNYPRRTDLWSVYIDMAMSQNDKEQIRHLFQRVTNLRLSSRKMRFFYKRYLDFEEKNGDKAALEAVREKAKQYVEELV